MNLTAIISFITSVAKMFPIVDKWLALYAEARMKSAESEHNEAWLKARVSWKEGNTIPIEEAIGSDNAGKPGKRPDGIEVMPDGGWKKNLAIAFLLILASCVSRERVQADIFKAMQIPVEVCGPKPIDLFASCSANPDQAWCYGVFRTVQCEYLKDHPVCVGKPAGSKFREFLPYCDARIAEHMTMHEDDGNHWLEKFTEPEGK